MDQLAPRIPVYVETGNKRMFAGAVEWPGWCRSARDEESALHKLFDFAARYQRALAGSPVAFKAIKDFSDFDVVERLKGNATTDFGAPAIPPTADNRPLDEPELQRFEAILNACWNALDASAKMAAGKDLAKGPRGGGRDLHQIVEHVLEAEMAYLSRLGLEAGQPPISEPKEPSQMREAILLSVRAAAGSRPHQGPKGGARWTPRYFVRRVAWHALDHAWEIEDRVVASTS
jgi:hypothetical protein